MAIIKFQFWHLKPHPNGNDDFNKNDDNDNSL